MPAMHMVILCTFAMAPLMGGCEVLRHDQDDAAGMAYAAETGNVGRIRSLAERHPDLLESRDPLVGYTPLIMAEQMKKLDAARVLVEVGADVNAHGIPNRGTALHVMAASSGFTPEERLDMARFLVAHGADVNSRDGDERTPLFDVATPALALLLIEHGADVNVRDHLGATPLHYLNALNSGETAEVLIAHGADVGARIREGSWVEGATPLHKAAGRLYDSPDLIRVLLAHGADVNARTDVGKGNSIKSGASPLYFAADRGNIESAKLLIRAGADLNIQDGQGWTPLHLACYRGRAAMVALLAESGANTNLLDHNGQTPLHLAAWQGSVSMVEVLLKHGADPNIAGKWGKPGKHASAAVKKILTRYGGTDD